MFLRTVAKWRPPFEEKGVWPPFMRGAPKNKLAQTLHKIWLAQFLSVREGTREELLQILRKLFLTLSRLGLGGPLGGLLESIVHKSAFSGPINMISSAKWLCYVLPIHVACSIMQIRPLVPKLQQVTGLRGR